MRAWGTIGVGVALICAGCSGVHSGVHWMQSRLTGPPAFEESAFARKPIAGHRIAVGADTTVIGRLGTHRVRPGETFFEIARYYDLGYGELVEANPGIDPLIPPVGKDLVLPTEWILPCCTYDGIVVNVPEMRLYFYRRSPDDPKTRLVETFPVGIGRESWRTPRGQFHIRRKTVNPRWVIPESIRQEHIREYGDARHSIAGRQLPHRIVPSHEPLALRIDELGAFAAQRFRHQVSRADEARIGRAEVDYRPR